jgi:hypothetical protein
MKIIHASKEYVDKLKSLPATKSENVTSINFLGLPIVESSLFPFEIMYDACSIETREEIKIASGEWIHGAIIPQPEPYKVEVPPIFTIYEESADVDDSAWSTAVKNYWGRNWGMEIFKF